MNKNAKLWMLPLAGSLVFATTGHGEEAAPTLERANLDSTNRLTLSLRFGLNITGKFTGIGRSFNPGATAGSGHYADGYVLTDVSGNFGGQSWYWGYQNASQVNASGANSIDFHNYSAPGLPNENSAKNPYVGFEIAYDYQIGVKEDWHHLAYGIEAAANYMPISFSTSSSFNGAISQQTDTYGYTSGTTPPGAPYAGSYEGPGFLLNSELAHPPVTAVIPGATIVTHQNLNANLWGFRLGPYLESPLTEKLFLHASGGFALGLLDANASWDETLTLPGSSLRSSGGGSNFEVLCGFYAGGDIVYHFNERWGVDVGAQFQNLGTYDHNFGGCSASLDLSKSIFIQAGLSYSF